MGCTEDVALNQLFGVSSGLGMGVLTFDWSMVSYIGSPLMVPWWAEVHVMIGFVLFYWILCPAMYYTNVSGLGMALRVVTDPFLPRSLDLELRLPSHLLQPSL